jgi:hypothetical protein
MKYIITESQYNQLTSEEINFDTTQKTDVSTDFVKDKYAKWFDYKSPKLKHMSFSQIEDSLNFTMDFYLKRQYKLKRILVKDDNELVGFLIYSTTTPKQEKIEDILEDKSYPILLSTAIAPNYRNRGLLKQMIDKANITKPFLVHTGQISTPGVWEKLGCRKIKNIDNDNFVELCN